MVTKKINTPNITVFITKISGEEGNPWTATKGSPSYLPGQCTRAKAPGSKVRDNHENLRKRRIFIILVFFLYIFKEPFILEDGKVRCCS